MMQIYENLEQLSQAAAELFIERANQAIDARGRFSVSLSGGHTPRRMYELLATPDYRSRLPWQNVHVFWGDERCVPRTDERYNARMTRLALLDHVPIPVDQIHPICGEIRADVAAIEYERRIRDFFAPDPPRFDLILLGLGSDGHTASLFPGTSALDAMDRWVLDLHRDGESFDRITFTAAIDQSGAPSGILSRRRGQVVGPTEDVGDIGLRAAIAGEIDSANGRPALACRPEGRSVGLNKQRNKRCWLMTREGHKPTRRRTRHIMSRLYQCDCCDSWPMANRRTTSAGHENQGQNVAHRGT